jgi:hypothetical protein
MNHRPLGRTGGRVSDISFGAWAIAGNWGHVSERALAALNKAVESGVNDLPPLAPREISTFSLSPYAFRRRASSCRSAAGGESG